MSTRFQAPPITPIDTAGLGRDLRARLDALAKPPGSLGRLETLAVELGLAQGRMDPQVERARALVFAGDHGLTEEGVSAYPAAVTQAMAATMLAGEAAVNVLARACGVEVVVVDAGVDAELAPHPLLLDRKVRRGARNAAREPALTPEERDQALTAGVALGLETEADVIVLGEMGIGNTASAALLMHRLLPAPLEDCVGQGTGHDAEGLARKHAALQRAAARVQPVAPMEVLAEFGGLEIAMMAGTVLGAAAARRPVIVDGFISSVAALAAIRLAPAARGYCLFSHVSAERGHRRMLEDLRAEPALDLKLRLGEGTGAVLAVPLVRAAAGLLSEMATLAEVLGRAAGGTA